MRPTGTGRQGLINTRGGREGGSLLSAQRAGDMCQYSLESMENLSIAQSMPLDFSQLSQTNLTDKSFPIVPTISFTRSSLISE